jgi:hypothetical protein
VVVAEVTSAWPRSVDKRPHGCTHGTKTLSQGAPRPRLHQFLSEKVANLYSRVDTGQLILSVTLSEEQPTILKEGDDSPGNVFVARTFSQLRLKPKAPTPVGW